MSKRKSAQATAKLKAALLLEKQHDYKGAIALYEKAVAADPANPQGWNRLMIAYRRIKSQAQEAKIIKTAIANYQKAIEDSQVDWIEKNREKVEGSRELAKALGMLDEKGLPQRQDQTLSKWQARLYLVEYRIRAKKKKAGKAKTKVRSV
ncbi:tetratricopeptide repeat protein [Pedobacter sp. Du54]|uniref:tetratricopeptide repeat protein n=1 Tax=Pedobacter anseongensis TaxID=3133439 RepID=UPI0030AA95F6